MVCGISVFVFVLLCITLCPEEEEEKAGRFAIIALPAYCYCKCYVALPHFLLILTYFLRLLLLINNLGLPFLLIFQGSFQK